MIHDLLLALWSYPGSLFEGGSLKVGGRADFPPSLAQPNALPPLPPPPQVSPEVLPFLHLSEATLLARVCCLGCFYICLQKFIEQFSEHAQLLLPTTGALFQACVVTPGEPRDTHTDREG